MNKCGYKHSSVNVVATFLGQNHKRFGHIVLAKEVTVIARSRFENILKEVNQHKGTYGGTDLTTVRDNTICCSFLYIRDRSM